MKKYNFIPDPRQESIEPYNSGKADIIAVVGQASVLAYLNTGSLDYVTRRYDAQLLDEFLA